MRINQIIPFEQNPFPTSNAELNEFAKNLSKNIETSSGGQVRRSANWIIAQVAKSFPSQPKSFNINALKAMYSALPERSLVEAVSDLNAYWAKATVELERLGREHLKSHSDIVAVIFDDEEDYFKYQTYMRYNRNGDVYACPNCGNVEEFEECESCSIQTHNSNASELDALVYAMESIKNQAKVAVPTLSDVLDSVEEKVTKTFIVVLQDKESPTLIKTMRVSLVNPGFDCFNAIGKKVHKALISDGYEPSDFEIVSYESLSEMTVV